MGFIYCLFTILMYEVCKHWWVDRIWMRLFCYSVAWILAIYSNGFWNWMVYMLLFYIGVIDACSMYIDAKVLFVLFLISSMFLRIQPKPHVVLACLCIVIPMYIINLCSVCFGEGDLQLMFVAGMLLGYPYVVYAFMIACVIGGGYASFLLFTNQKEQHRYIPFAPFLCLGIGIMFAYHQI